MRTAKRLGAVLVLLAAAVSSLPYLPAQEKGPDKTVVVKPKGKAAEAEARVAAEERKAEEALRNEVASFGALVEFGKKYKVPEALADAGGLLLKLYNTDLDELEAEPSVELPKDAPRKEPKFVSLQTQADDLFDEARGCTKDQRALEAYLRTVKAKAEDGFGTRSAKGGKQRGNRKIERDRERVKRDRVRLDRDRARLEKDRSKPAKTRHRDVALNGSGLKQYQDAFRASEKHTLQFAAGGKAGAVCFQGSTELLVEVIEGKGNTIVWSSRGLSGQYQYPAGQSFSVRISAPAGPATYTLLAN